MNYEYCDGVTYTIKKGDTLYEISRKYNIALALLLRANPYVDVFNLQVGDTICIPTGSEATPYPLRGGVRDDDDRDDRNDDRRDDGDEMLEELIDELDDNMEERYRETEPDESRENVSVANWEKYVVQPGDTLEDVLRDMDGTIEMFLERNPSSNIYMLPGVAYYICKNK